MHTSAAPSNSRFVVGIDLGTTNSVVAYVDTAHPEPRPQILSLPQLTGAGSVESRPLLPSFLYLPAAGEFAPEALALPWGPQPDRIVGAFARTRGAEAPARLVSSAKSWLSHAGADRTAAILPWGSPDDVPRVSPVEASARYLRHMRDGMERGVPGRATRRAGRAAHRAGLL